MSSRQRSPRQSPPPSGKRDPALDKSAFPVVGLGASAGGLHALLEFFHHLPEKPGMAFVVVQHMDPDHTSNLALLLGKESRIPVTEVRSPVRLAPNRVFVIAPNRLLVMAKGMLKPRPRKSAKPHQPAMSVDTFLSSLAREHKGLAIGVILSGSGSDGAKGVRAVKEAGGVNFAQTERSAQHAEMPAAAIGTGCVDFVLPPAAMPERILDLMAHPYLNGKESGKIDSAKKDKAMARIFDALHNHAGVNFRHYKSPTVMRRIYRRMALLKIRDVEDYAAHLNRHPRELGALYNDMLINVTEFFRDPGVFTSLRKKHFLRLLKDKPAGTPIRIWIPGCSSGEEVYSLVICLLDFLGRRAGSHPLQVFGTDVSAQALNRARTGLYPAAIASKVPPAILKKHFTKVNGDYQINKYIRSLCVFAIQNLNHDPPFSNLDLISCRNLMIYLGPSLQRRAMTTFHYALKPHGLLVLGASESVVGYESFFSEVDKRNRIYERRPSVNPPRIEYAFEAAGVKPPDPVPRADTGPWHEQDAQREADRVLLRRYVPAAILVNEDLEIVQIRGHTGDFLEPSPGVPSLNLLKMAREGLFMDLRAAIQQARRRGIPARREPVDVRTGSGWRQATIEVIPLARREAKDRHFLVVFELLPATKEETRPARRRPAADREIARLKDDLIANREYVKSIIEDLESANENLKAANEEIQSSNEELQSTNEELETAKEELQSTNEELTTVNEELATRNDELARLNADLVNLLTSVDLAIVMLDHDGCIRRMTPMAEKVLQLLPSDTGRKITELRLPVPIPDLGTMIDEAMRKAEVCEREVEDREGRWHLLNVRPYRSADNRIDGAVLVLVDIDVRKKALMQVQASGIFARTIVDTVPQPLVVLDGRMHVLTSNRSYHELFKSRPESTDHQLFFKLHKGLWNQLKLRQALGRVLSTGSRMESFRMEPVLANRGRCVLLVSACRFSQLSLGENLILLMIEDVTEQTRLQQGFEEQVALVRLATTNVPVVMLSLDASGRITFIAGRGLKELSIDPAKVTGHSAMELASRLPLDRDILRRTLRGEDVTWHGQVHERHYETRLTPLKSRQGKVTGIVGVCIDVTTHRKLEAEIQHISEFERQRIGSDLHDGMAQTMTGLRLGMSNLAMNLADKGVSEAALAERLVGQLSEATRQMVALARELIPVELKTSGLPIALEKLAHSTVELSSIRCECHCRPNVRIDNSETSRQLYRIAQEAVTNAVKHSRTSMIRIILQKRRGLITLTVKDDGRGFNPKKTSGLGLHIMQYRATIIGARLDIESRPGEGTVITCRVSDAKEA